MIGQIKSQREDERRKALERKREDDRQKELQQRKLDDGGGDSKKTLDETTTKSDVDANRDSSSSRDPNDSSSKSTSENPRSFPQNSNNNSGNNLNGGQPITNLLQEKGRENERKRKKFLHMSIS